MAPLRKRCRDDGEADDDARGDGVGLGPQQHEKAKGGIPDGTDPTRREGALGEHRARGHRTQSAGEDGGQERVGEQVRPQRPPGEEACRERREDQREQPSRDEDASAAAEHDSGQEHDAERPDEADDHDEQRVPGRRDGQPGPRDRRGGDRVEGPWVGQRTVELGVLIGVESGGRPVPHHPFDRAEVEDDVGHLRDRHRRGCSPSQDEVCRRETHRAHRQDRAQGAASAALARAAGHRDRIARAAPRPRATTSTTAIKPVTADQPTPTARTPSPAAMITATLTAGAASTAVSQPMPTERSRTAPGTKNTATATRTAGSNCGQDIVTSSELSSSGPRHAAAARPRRSSRSSRDRR